MRTLSQKLRLSQLIGCGLCLTGLGAIWGYSVWTVGKFELRGGTLFTHELPFNDCPQAVFDLAQQISTGCLNSTMGSEITSWGVSWAVVGTLHVALPLALTVLLIVILSCFIRLSPLVVGLSGISGWVTMIIPLYVMIPLDVSNSREVRYCYVRDIVNIPDVNLLRATCWNVFWTSVSDSALYIALPNWPTRTVIDAQKVDANVICVNASLMLFVFWVICFTYWFIGGRIRQVQAYEHQALASAEQLSEALAPSAELSSDVELGPMSPAPQATAPGV